MDAWKKGKKCNVECYNCHKRGHIKADCWAKGGCKEGQGPWKKGSGSSGGSGTKSDAMAGAELAGEKSPDIEAWAATEEVEVEDEDTPQVPAMAADETGGAEIELYDSGASRHMSPYHE